MRTPSLRQIEAFRAVVETGTVSKAAELLHISQPAASKLLIHLEEDTGLQLFDRESGRLVLTDRGMRLYEEIDRIFSGVNQINRAVEMIRREDRGRLKVGVLPGLSGKFIAQVVKRFSDRYPDVYVTVDMRSSQFLTEWLITRQLDVGILTTAVEQTELVSVELMRVPMVCIMPLDHPLTALKEVGPKDLGSARLLTYSSGTSTRRAIAASFEQMGYKMFPAMEASMAMSICECVAEGLGVSLMHPLLVQTVTDRVAIRPFVPATEVGFQLCRPPTTRNVALVDAFIEEAHAVARASLDQLKL